MKQPSDPEVQHQAIIGAACVVVVFVLLAVLVHNLIAPTRNRIIRRVLLRHAVQDMPLDSKSSETPTE